MQVVLREPVQQQFFTRRKSAAAAAVGIGARVRSPHTRIVTLQHHAEQAHPCRT
jgi:hypothetical protein